MCFAAAKIVQVRAKSQACLSFLPSAACQRGRARQQNCREQWSRARTTQKTRQLDTWKRQLDTWEIQLDTWERQLDTWERQLGTLEKTTRHLEKTTRHLGKTTRHLEKTTRHLGETTRRAVRGTRCAPYKKRSHRKERAAPLGGYACLCAPFMERRMLQHFQRFRNFARRMPEARCTSST